MECDGIPVELPTLQVSGSITVQYQGQSRSEIKIYYLIGPYFVGPYDEFFQKISKFSLFLQNSDENKGRRNEGQNCIQ